MVNSLGTAAVAGDTAASKADQLSVLVNNAMMTAISYKLKTVEIVFVVGHKNLDMDALGASVGMAHFASLIVRKSYAVYDDMAMNTDIERAVERLKEDGQSPLITLSEAEELVNQHS